MKMSTRTYKSFRIFLNLLILGQMACCPNAAAVNTAGRHSFARELFKNIAPNYATENVIYSPASIQSCLTLAFMGAEGQTADELRKGLHLGSEPKQSIAQNYADFIQSTFHSTKENAPILKMANNIYLNEKLEIQPEFAELAQKNFDSKVEQINFAESSAIEKINSWVESQTNNKIQNLLQPGSVDGDTSSVLVNAIYFKGLWEVQFSESSTTKDRFYMDEDRHAEVDMMYNDDTFKYASLSGLDATAVALPYENSDLSMLIILPNKKNGLKSLEAKLAEANLNDIFNKMSLEDVDVMLPKFKIEFDIDLKEPLTKMGMSTMFSNAADFSALIKSDGPRQKVSDVKHKAFLEVNEAGSEAAAATFLKIVPMSLNLQQKRFKADHPFVFAILDTKAVYFAGHVAKF